MLRKNFQTEVHGSTGWGNSFRDLCVPLCGLFPQTVKPLVRPGLFGTAKPVPFRQRESPFAEFPRRP